KRPAADRQTPGAARCPDDTERLDGDEDRRPTRARFAARPLHSERAAVMPRLEAARIADPDIVQKRVARPLAALAALFEIEGGVEFGLRVAPLLRALFEVMDQRVDITLGNVGIGRQIVFGVKQPGFSYLF